MQKVDHLVAAPGCCWKCRSSNRSWYIDTGQSIDYYGAVYICDECCTEIGHVADMITAEEAATLRKRSENLDEDNYQLKLKILGLEQAVDGLRIAGRSIGTGAGPSSTLLNDSAKQAISESRKDVGVGKGTSFESGDDEGLAIVSDDDSKPGDFSFTL